MSFLLSRLALLVCICNQLSINFSIKLFSLQQLDYRVLLTTARTRSFAQVVPSVHTVDYTLGWVQNQIFYCFQSFLGSYEGNQVQTNLNFP